MFAMLDKYIERQWSKHIAKMEQQEYEEVVFKAAEKIIDRELQKAHIIWLLNQEG